MPGLSSAAAADYSSLSFSPLHRLARRVARRRLPRGIASLSFWREAFGPKSSDSLPAVTYRAGGLSSSGAAALAQWGYSFRIDGDRGRLIAIAPDDGRCLPNKVFSLASLPLSVFASISTIEE